MKRIPIFIVNFNRFAPTKKLVEFLLNRNYTNIVIIDNASEYPPLLDWYDTCPVTICRLDGDTVSKLGDNVHGVLNKLTQFQPIVSTQLYVYSDSDVLPVDEIPDNFIEHMCEMVNEHKFLKLGLSLKIDDLPGHYKHKADVIAWESHATEHGHIDASYCRIYNAAVDTTFAVNATPVCGYIHDARRTGWPYSARHLPWYYDSNNLPEDEKMLRVKKHPLIGMWSSRIG